MTKVSYCKEDECIALVSELESTGKCEKHRKSVCVLCKTNKAVHCWECSMDLVKKAKKKGKVN